MNETTHNAFNDYVGQHPILLLVLAVAFMVAIVYIMQFVEYLVNRNKKK